MVYNDFTKKEKRTRKDANRNAVLVQTMVRQNTMNE